MPRQRTGIGSGVAAAVAAAVLYWILNSTSQVNGVGLLQQQAWPVNQLWVWAAVGFVIGIIAGRGSAVRGATHARAIRDLAERLGRAYAESYALPPGAEGLPLFAGWSGGRNAMTGTADGVPVALFDFTTVPQDCDATEQTNGTAAVLPAADLPDFDLRPRTIGWRLLSWAGFEGVTFAAGTGASFAAEAVRKFSALFHLSSASPTAVLDSLRADNRPDLAEQEEAIRRVFTPDVMQRFNRYPAYAVQSHSGFLAVRRGSGILPAAERVDLWDAAVALRAALTVPRDREAGPVAAGRTGNDKSRQARKLRNTAFGGVVGLYLGFVACSMVGAYLFFQQQPGPRSAFLLGLLLFFGMLLAAAAVGAGIGALLPVRELPPQPAEDRMTRQAREWATGCGATAGMFLGFFGGFAASWACKFLLDWKHDDFGVESAVFFGSSFGGALLGSVVLGLIVNRLCRWRQRKRQAPPGCRGTP